MRKVLHFGLTAILAGALLLAGCSSNEKPTESTSSTDASAGGILNIALHADPPKLDPAYSSTFVDRMVLQSIFDKLVDLDENGKIVPMLAESWEISSDNKTYTFKLRQGVKFHDGSDFNAEAVTYNFERNMDKDSVRRNELKSVDKVTAVDPYTVKVHLKQPYAPFLAVLTDRTGMMVSPEAAKKAGKDFMNNPVGTGPFIYKERVKGSTVTLEKNENYWRESLPKLQKVVFKIMSDSNVALMNLKSGQVDMTSKLPFKEIENVKSEPNLQVINEVSQGYYGVYLNTTKPPFDKKELRQAFDLLIDRDAIVNVVLNNAGSAAHSPFAPSHFAYGDSDKAEKPDVAKAKDLLRKAGVENGFSFTLKLEPLPSSQQMGQMIQNMLKPAGIDVKLEKVELGTLLEQLTTGNMEATILNWSGRPDPDQNIYDFLVTDGPQNYSHFSNQEVDQRLNAARMEMDEGKRKAIYDEVMKILHEEVPQIYLYHEHIVSGMSKSVQGYKYVPDGLIRTAELSK
ncbi:ABC transporter substrate-binding protein [Brevibacillus sp. NRS-1366]|uniref:ABC transporter substrate-binding protein n=1 Tax=Brevibacillus sp. NRS-1366 TaxID=3233899 RepID=UPI003D25CE2E